MYKVPKLLMEYKPAALNMDGISINGVAATSNAFGLLGGNRITLEVVHVNASGGTPILCHLTLSHDGTNFGQMQAGAVSSGTETMSSHTISSAIGGAATFYYNWVFGEQQSHHLLGAEEAKIVVGALGASDTVTVTAKVWAV